MRCYMRQQARRDEKSEIKQEKDKRERCPEESELREMEEKCWRHRITFNLFNSHTELKDAEQLTPHMTEKKQDLLSY